ncbi:MAG: tRNA (N(6)-L-threonylcarbamoyladenosine(37)-C(2))- methylthiotransferase MtaB [Candidatus Poribacteria bacterium]|nr:MAG: tRNA (N(6)-L-threonylcarbamoyladenosine(37)-C(2))- methylthiotransferase MtaB [Candidatus Poribacteria bacterium]
MRTAALITFGCKANQYDSQALREALEEIGYRIVPPTVRADLYVVNTCTVTSMADAKARRAIRRIHRLSPESAIFVTGCYAQKAKEELLRLEGVTKVFGNREKFSFRELIREAERVQSLQREFVGDPDAPVDLGEFGLSVTSFDERTRALIKLQDGCSAFCTYCIVPYVRGRMRSRPLPEIVAEAERLAARGFREVVITGVHLGAYGKDVRYRWTLADVLCAVHEVEGIQRIRLSSLEPMDVPQALIETIAGLPKCARHLHLPLQSGSTAVLRRMRRRYTQEQFLALVEAVFEAMPDAGLTTDVMVGFPGETEADFHETLRVVEKSRFHRLHVFRYSPREGTPAADYPDQVPASVATERSERLRRLGERLEREYQESWLGAVLSVLIEDRREGPNDELAGYSGNYLRVLVADAGPEHVGTLQPVRIEAIVGGHWVRGRLAVSGAAPAFAS